MVYELLAPACFVTQIRKSCGQCKSPLLILLITVLPCGPDECSLMHSSPSAPIYIHLGATQLGRLY